MGNIISLLPQQTKADNKIPLEMGKACKPYQFPYNRICRFYYLLRMFSYYFPIA